MPKGWDKRGTGRRLVLFPGLTGSDPDTVFKNVIAESERCLILVPHGPAATKVKENLPTGWSSIGADAIGLISQRLRRRRMLRWSWRTDMTAWICPVMAAACLPLSASPGV